MCVCVFQSECLRTVHNAECDTVCIIMFFAFRWWIEHHMKTKMSVCLHLSLVVLYTVVGVQHENKMHCMYKYVNRHSLELQEPKSLFE